MMKKFGEEPLVVAAERQIQIGSTYCVVSVLQDNQQRCHHAKLRGVFNNPDPESSLTIMILR